MVGTPQTSWKSVNASNELLRFVERHLGAFKWKDPTFEKYLMCIMGNNCGN